MEFPRYHSQWQDEKTVIAREQSDCGNLITDRTFLEIATQRSQWQDEKTVIAKEQSDYGNLMMNCTFLEIARFACNDRKLK